MIFILSLGLTISTLAQTPGGLNPTTEVTTSLRGNGTPGPYQLKDYFILPGTEKVSKNGVLLEPDRDYLIDYNQGQITLSYTLFPHDTLSISYQRLNPNLRKKYFHRELVWENDHTPPTGLAIPIEKGSNGWGGNRRSFLSRRGSSDLIFSGSKTFSLEIGSAQDISLKQGLWLSAKGRATKNLNVSLQLSDQNMPLTYQGRTKRLEELDKVQILVKSPNFSATLGDYSFEPFEFDFFSNSKRVKGIKTEVNVGGSSFSFAVASSEGEFFTNQFFGEENKQGPYQLKGKNQETNITILPGTERVWVNGERMERGSDNDYTIDYQRGTIQFTPRRLITSDSRITVDFEYSAESYRRDFYSGGLLASLFGGKAEFKAAGVFERDNKHDPLSFSPSSENARILSQAGNDRLLASRDGATFVGESQGDYQLAYDSSGNPYYQFVGVDSGSYKVSFSWVGEGKGSYQYKGGGVYQYVHPGNGDFLPVQLLPLPESHSLLDLSFSLLPDAALKTQIEWAKSKRDKNTLSPKDDKHNWGDALSFKSRYQNSNFKLLKSNFHRLKLECEYRLVNRNFVPFGRVDIVEKNRRWDLPQKALGTDERTYQFSGVVAPWKMLLLNLDYGRLDWGNEFSSRRRSLGITAFPKSWISTKGRTEVIKTRKIDKKKVEKLGEWKRNLLALESKLKKLSTTISWEGERRSSSLTDSIQEEDNFNQLSGGVSLGLSNLIKARTKLSYREEDQLREGNRKESICHTWINEFSLRDLKGMLSSDLKFTRRIKEYKSVSGGKMKENLLICRMDFYPPSQLLAVKFYHSQNQIHSSRRVDTYLEVNPGKGDYRYEDGEYVPHPEGDFIRLSEWVGATQASLDLNKSIRISLSPHKVPAQGDKTSLFFRIGRIFSTDSFVNLRGRFKDQKALSFYFLYPLTRLSNERILSQDILVRHDLYLLPTFKPLNFRLRWEMAENKDNLVSSGERQNRRLKQELLLRSYLSPQYSLESRIGRERIKDRGGGKLRDLIEEKSWLVGLTRRESAWLELEISTKYKSKREQIQGKSAKFFSVSPEILWSLLSQGRLKAQLQWTRLKSFPKGRSLSYNLSEGKRPGENYEWKFLFDYKLNRYLTTSVVYSGESISGQKAKHMAKMELKAFF